MTPPDLPDLTTPSADWLNDLSGKIAEEHTRRNSLNQARQSYDNALRQAAGATTPPVDVSRKPESGWPPHQQVIKSGKTYKNLTGAWTHFDPPSAGWEEVTEPEPDPEEAEDPDEPTDD